MCRSFLHKFRYIASHPPLYFIVGREHKTLDWASVPAFRTREVPKWSSHLYIKSMNVLPHIKIKSFKKDWSYPLGLPLYNRRNTIKKSPVLHKMGFYIYSNIAHFSSQDIQLERVNHDISVEEILSKSNRMITTTRCAEKILKLLWRMY